jgi:hypothetical protein
MLYTDLLRLTVLLIAGEGTALAGVTIVAANRHDDTQTLLLAAGWWIAAAIIGALAGRSARAARAVGPALAASRTATSLPSDSAGRIMRQRLWPLGVFALLCGGLAWLWPQVAAIGAGYAVLFSLQMRNREAAVLGVQERDGVLFYVEPTSALRPISLVRTPGLRRDVLQRETA